MNIHECAYVIFTISLTKYSVGRKRLFFPYLHIILIFKQMTFRESAGDSRNIAKAVGGLRHLVA
jgi:hypothetical protein